MSQLLQQIVAGIGTGLLYGLLALAVVLVFRASQVLNFAQGALATMSAYLAWSLSGSVPLALAILLALVLSFVLGAGTYRLFIRPFEQRPHLQSFVVIIMIFQITVSLCQGIWGADPRTLEAPVGRTPLRLGEVVVSTYDLYTLAVAAVCMAGLFALFRFTRVGLALRAVADDPGAAEVAGISTTRMLTVGWGLAGVGGAVAGILAAPVLGLTPELMFSVLIGALCAVVVGGLESPVGAIVGGILVAVWQNLVSTYIGAVVGAVVPGAVITDPAAYRDVATAVLLLAVLLAKPSGLFGAKKVARL